MNKIGHTLQNLGFSICSMYMLDVTFISDNTKFISGVLQALTAMMSLGLPHLTVLTKCDILPDKKMIDEYNHLLLCISFKKDRNTFFN